MGVLGALLAALVVPIAAGPLRAQVPLSESDVGLGALPPVRIAGLDDTRPYAPMEFSRAWLARVAQVRLRREELRAQGKLDGLSPRAAAREGAALEGTLRVLVIPVLYAGQRAPFPTQALSARLFGEPRGDTMSYSAYFDEVSDGLLRVTGQVTSWVRLPHPARYYLPADDYGWGRFGRVKQLREEALRQVEKRVDLGRFDNDGPDGVPDSGDDDGFVDFVVFVYALPCGEGADLRTGAIWPHRGAMQPFLTNQPARGGGRLRIADYVILPAVDPRTCGPLQVGVLAHETGHVLGLPDLYAYDGLSQGIGAWGLMGTGSHNAPYSPAHLQAWSLEQLGWAREVWLRRDTTGLRLAPVETSHTIYRYDLPGTDGEYLLFENRQRIGSDRALPGHGVLAWHVDPEQGELGSWNSDERRPALAVLRADGAPEPYHARLADAADPFPGKAHRRLFQLGSPGGFSLSALREDGGVVTANVHVPPPADTVGHSPEVLRLAAPEGAVPVARVVRIGELAGSLDWTARGAAPWLRARRDGDALVVSADPAALTPGAYEDTLSLQTPGDSSLARKVVVALEVAAPGGAEIVATGLSWSWGLAADNGRILQAGYGWDPLGLRPRPRVLELDREHPLARTLVRIPSDALYAPVVAPGGGAYVLARAEHANLVYRVGDDGSAAFVARLGTGVPAYGAAPLPDGSLLVADWSGSVRRVAPDGSVSPYLRVPEHLYQIATDSAGDLVAAGYRGDVLRIARNGALHRLHTGFGRGRLVAVAAAPCGDIYAAERGGKGRIIRFDARGRVDWTIAIPDARFYGLTVDGSFLYALDLAHRQLLRIPITGCAPAPPPHAASSPGTTQAAPRG